MALPTCTVAWEPSALESRLAYARGIQQGRCIVNAGGIAVTGGRADSTRVKHCIRHTRRKQQYGSRVNKGVEVIQGQYINTHTFMGLERYNACEVVTHQNVLAVSDSGLGASFDLNI